MEKKSPLSLGTYYEQFIQDLLSQGRYETPSDVLRAGLRLLEEEENKRTALKAAVQHGIESGLAADFDPETYLNSMKKKKSTNA